MINYGLQRRLKMVTFDFRNAYLNAHLREDDRDVYVSFPPFYFRLRDEERGGKVLKLNKALYGLKRSASLWQKHIKDHLVGKGFKECDNVYKLDNIFIALYVDDGLLLYNSSDELLRVKKILNEFEINWEEDLKKLLGFEITLDKDKKTISLTKEKAVLDIAAMIGTNEEDTKVKRVKLPHIPHHYIEVNEKGIVDEYSYRSAIGKLINLGNMLRVDCCYAINYLGRFTHLESKVSWRLIHQVTRYLLSTKKEGIVLSYNKDNIENKVTVFVDSDKSGDSFAKALQELF